MVCLEPLPREGPIPCRGASRISHTTPRTTDSRSYRPAGPRLAPKTRLVAPGIAVPLHMPARPPPDRGVRRYRRSPDQLAPIPRSLPQPWSRSKALPCEQPHALPKTTDEPRGPPLPVPRGTPSCTPSACANPRTSTAVGALQLYAQRRHDLHLNCFRHPPYPRRGAPQPYAGLEHPACVKEESAHWPAKHTSGTVLDTLLHPRRRAIPCSETLYHPSRAWDRTAVVCLVRRSARPGSTQQMAPQCASTC